MERRWLLGGLAEIVLGMVLVVACNLGVFLLAEYYRFMGRYAEAEPLYKGSLAVTEKVLGPEHALVAEVLHNLSGVYDVLGREVEAERIDK